MNDKLTEILNYIEENETIYITGKRIDKKQVNVDKRTYIVFILITKYGLSYKRLVNIFKFDHTACYHTLNKIECMLSNKTFNLNTLDVQDLFPYSEEDIIRLQTIIKNRKKIKSDEEINISNCENVFKLSKEDIIKLKNNPIVIKTIKNIINML